MNTTQTGSDERIKIIDNWLDKDVVTHLSDQVLYNYPHYFVESSLNKGPTMYSHDVGPGNLLIDFLFNKIKKEYEPTYGQLDFTRTYFNIAHPGMDGEFHVDSKDPNAGPSFMLMITPKGKEGAFYYKPDPNDDLCIEKIDYKEGRFLIFDSDMEHYGQSFKDKPRITMVFKTYVEPK
jgi:hypothetical protein